jgi:hypothetical protein
MVAESLQRNDRGRIARLHIILFLFSLAVFLAAPVIEVSDSRYAVMLSESFWRHGSADLDEHYQVPAPYLSGDAYLAKDANEYQLVKARGHVTYYFPQGTSILSVPLVAALNTTTGWSAAKPDGHLNLDGEIRIGRCVASLLMAGSTCVFFAMAMMLLPVAWSVVVALGASFGTQILSTATRGLWSHDWEIFLYALTAYSLLRSDHREMRFHPAWIATLVAWIYFVRPTGAVAMIAVSSYVLLVHRRDVIAYALTLGGWLAAFVGYSWTVFGTILPPYYMASRIRFENFAVALAGNLIGPARGLFVYVPVTLSVLYLAVRYRKQLAHKPLATLALGQIAGLWMVIGTNFYWAAGYCYGPRYFSDAIPWFVLLGILGIHAMRRTPAPSGHRMEIAAAIFLLAVSIAMNARGAWSYEAVDWVVSKWVTRHGFFDWRYPQFMAGLMTEPKN